MWLQPLAHIHTEELLKTRYEGPEERVSVRQGVEIYYVSIFQHFPTGGKVAVKLHTQPQEAD